MFLWLKYIVHIVSTLIKAAVVAQSVREFASHVEGWVLESRPRRT